MERETKTLTTPEQKHKVEVYTYLTGREFEYVQSPLIEAMSVRPEGTKGTNIKFGDLDVNKVQESTHRLIEKHVVSVNGEKEKLMDKVLDMHNDDYQYVVQEIQNISKKN